MEVPMEQIFILLSIKTRIETQEITSDGNINRVFLSYYPLKQGLKQLKYRACEILAYDFYPTIH